MSANDKQCGGNHYKNMQYQYWDMVDDTNMPYLLGCVVKYIHRYRYKHGAKDLSKGIHYLEKAMEKDCIMPPHDKGLVDRYVKQLNAYERVAIQLIVCSDFNEAITQIRFIIREIEFGGFIKDEIITGDS